MKYNTIIDFRASGRPATPEEIGNAIGEYNDGDAGIAYADGLVILRHDVTPELRQTFLRTTGNSFTVGSTVYELLLDNTDIATPQLWRLEADLYAWYCSQYAFEYGDD